MTLISLYPFIFNLSSNRYFACLASYNAVKKCSSDPDTGSNSASAAAAIAAAECGELSTLQNVEEAVRFGKDGKNCDKKYLCSNNCIYNPINKTCLKSNCRSRRIKKRSLLSNLKLNLTTSLIF